MNPASLPTWNWILNGACNQSTSLDMHVQIYKKQSHRNCKLFNLCDESFTIILIHIDIYLHLLGLFGSSHARNITYSALNIDIFFIKVLLAMCVCVCVCVCVCACVCVMVSPVVSTVSRKVRIQGTQQRSDGWIGGAQGVPKIRRHQTKSQMLKIHSSHTLILSYTRRYELK